MTSPFEPPESPSVYDRIDGLEAEISELKELIRKFVEIGPNNGREAQGWEVANILVNWLNRE